MSASGLSASCSRRAASEQRAVGSLEPGGHGGVQPGRARAHGAQRHPRHRPCRRPLRAVRPPWQRLPPSPGVVTHIIYFTAVSGLCVMQQPVRDFVGPQVAAIPFDWPVFRRTPQGQNPLYREFCAAESVPDQPDTAPAAASQPAPVLRGATSQRGRGVPYTAGIAPC